MKEIKVTCDYCNQNLTSTSNCIDWRIKISNDQIPCCGEFVTSMMIYEPIDGGDKHFCGIGCMKKWVNK